jgi:protein tyrosine/serine phosphatase
MKDLARTPLWLELDGTANARVVVPDVLLRSDNLQDLGERDVRLLLEEQNLEAVIDLRTEVEVQLEGPGPLTREPAVRIEHRSLYPQMGNTDFDLEPGTVNPWANRLGDDRHAEESPVVRAYMRYLNHRPDSIVAAIRTIARAGGAVLVHCAAGKDRTGVIIALALDAVGVDREWIVSDYMATGERIHPLMERLMSSPTYSAELAGHDPADHAPPAGTIERVFELIEENFGGTAPWLSSHGFTEEDLALLRNRLAPGG